MPVYNGSVKQKELYYGGTKIKEAYYGSTKIYSAGYPAGTVIFEKSTAGTYTVTLKHNQKYEIWMVGGGSGGCHRLQATTAQNWWYDNFSGGSGGYIHGIKKINAGTYTLVVGKGGAGGNAGNNAGGNTTGFGETAGGATSSGWKYVGKGGSNTTSLSQSVKGNDGIGSSTGYSDPTNAGGASVYGGYGAGGNSHDSPGVAGYIKIVAVQS